MSYFFKIAKKKIAQQTKLAAMTIFWFLYQPQVKKSIVINRLTQT